MDIQKEIIRITSIYFEDHSDALQLLNATQAYKTLLDNLCGQNMDVEEGRKDLQFDNGKSLGTFWAALCLNDIYRTQKFIRGIDEAIQDKMNAQKPIHILYAGTGPFATLLLPIILRYSKQDLKYTFLEINPFSFSILQDIISKLGLEEYDITLVNADATTYQLNPENEPDIIVSETMQNALAKEQQVPIFLNLVSQAKPDCIFIPEKIELMIGLKKAGIPITDITQKDYHKVNSVFEVSKAALFPQNEPKRSTPSAYSFKKMQTVIENEKLKGFDQLVIITEIQVYKNEYIRISESGLTTPIYIQDIPNNLSGAITIDTHYKISDEPKLEYKITLPSYS